MILIFLLKEFVISKGKNINKLNKLIFKNLAWYKIIKRKGRDPIIVYKNILFPAKMRSGW